MRILESILKSTLRFWLPDLILPLGYGISLTLITLLDVALYMVLYMMLPHGASS